MRARRLALLAALATLPIAPAEAHSPAWAGGSCWLVAVRSAGFLGSPTWVAVHGTAPAFIDVTCWIQVNISAYGTPTGAPSQHNASGPGWVPPATTPVAHPGLPSDNIFVCTNVMIGTGAAHTVVYQFDSDDNAANGNQCELARRAGAVDVVESEPASDPGDR